MSAHDIALAVLLGITVLTCFEGSLGVAVMRDPFQRLHYIAVPAGISILALTTAVVVQEGWSQQTIKVILIMFLLMLMNGVVTHATARAARIRANKQLPPSPGEKIPIHGHPGFLRTEPPPAARE
jgi:monovalent cation/proton antiporter MnhG/PhaG subunit